MPVRSPAPRFRLHAVTAAVLATLGAPAIAADSASAEAGTPRLADVVVTGAADAPTHFTSPSVLISAEQAEQVNATSVEDVFKYEPSMVVRKRYIGDSNGTVAMRGANMFQTARTMVFADGMPLHSLLETRWSGAPRWGLVAADELESAEVIYGPFSAEYSGNAMGGVVNMKTKMPTERVLHAEAASFHQQFDHLGADQIYSGHREYLAFGDAFGDLRLFVFHNHLENKGQPQTFRSRSVGTPAGGATVITDGAIRGRDSQSSDVIWVGDSGPAATITDLSKFKLGYTLGEWQATATVAYEDRDWRTRPTNYLRDAAGNTIWSGNAVYNGAGFSVNSSHFAISDQIRQTLQLGVGLEGPLGRSGWTLETNLSHFDVLKDHTRSSNKNPDDPTYTTAGSVSDYEDTGWLSLDVKARTDRFAGREDMNFVTGYHFDRNSLAIDSYDSTDYTVGAKSVHNQTTGGKTRTHAIFGQWGWDFAPQWDVAVGARYEQWQTYDGFYYKHKTAALLDFEDRDATGFSPKFSLGFQPAEAWQLRYSIGRAYRFPIVEELFSNEEKINSSTIANAHLRPEVGIHHNFMVERLIANGFVRANLFHENVKDAIWSQTDVINSVSTFLPVDKVRTTGLELVLQQNRVFALPVDLNANITWTDSKIVKNSADPSTEGKVFPRMPRWRANLLATWHAGDKLDTSLGLRYASNSYGNLDNSDKESNVYGAQDDYLFVDLKATYRVTQTGHLAVGIDNLFNDDAFVAHPWPQRTLYVEAKLSF